MPRVDVTPNWIRRRQFDPSECVPGTFRTKEIGDGTQIVLCQRKGAGWGAQSIRTRR